LARPIAQDHDEKRRLILDRAAQLFADEGFDRASVSSVAKACNISKANIYHYYSSKDDILFDILDNYLRDLRDRICGMDIAGLGAEEKFRRTILEVLLAYQGSNYQHRLQTNSMGHLPENQRAILTEYQRDFVNHASILVGDIAPHVFDGDKHKLRSATMAVFGMLNWFYMWNEDADREAREDYADIVCKMSLLGIPGL
jgi:AcrR family transcriptional regulator